ncbi:MAG: hypothetical protein V1768_03760 [Patescibacteria group bacterium]|nr:hypothetical protein [Patescibacteria group bacterium]MBU1160596.1 hypothetical protein [Patescibacteria group bacterium]MBU1349941.1 hypothetical protein [Patescibacteria group bacterium]MBU1420908.1 hypothetical protein [Patescibacteria group bacterium]MBU1684538.1 hypothetical protein [Patescibacteria group bacterium]
MITLSNGHRIEYVAGSGTLGFNGKGYPWEWPLRWVGLLDPSLLFTIVLKTLTYHPRQGNFKFTKPWKSIRFLNNGVVNAMGLPNKGIRWWMQNIAPTIDFSKLSIIGSIFAENVAELREMLWMLQHKFVALEINVSCPSAKQLDAKTIIRYCEIAAAETNKPIILKLSVSHDIKTIIPDIEGIVEAISINSVPWKIVFPYHKSPFQHFGGGGISGKIAQPYTWNFVRRLTQLTLIPIIGPSVWEYEDIERLRQIGAGAISFGSIFLRYPWRPTSFVRQDMKK